LGVSGKNDEGGVGEVQNELNRTDALVVQTARHSNHKYMLKINHIFLTIVVNEVYELGPGS